MEQAGKTSFSVSSGTPPGGETCIDWKSRFAILCSSAAVLLPSVTQAKAPVFLIATKDSSIKFFVKASVSIEGAFDKWNATLTFRTPEVSTGVLNIKIQAASVNTGSGMKDGTLKGKDFFDIKQNPLITFVSKKIVQTGPDTFEVDGDFTIRGVTKTEMLTLTVSGKGTGTGSIRGTMAFDRKDLRDEQRHSLHQDRRPG